MWRRFYGTDGRDSRAFRHPPTAPSRCPRPALCWRAHRAQAHSSPSLETESPRRPRTCAGELERRRRKSEPPEEDPALALGHRVGQPRGDLERSGSSRISPPGCTARISVEHALNVLESSEGSATAPLPQGLVKADHRRGERADPGQIERRLGGGGEQVSTPRDRLRVVEAHDSATESATGATTSTSADGRVDQSRPRAEDVDAPDRGGGVVRNQHAAAGTLDRLDHTHMVSVDGRERRELRPRHERPRRHTHEKSGVELPTQTAIVHGESVALAATMDGDGWLGARLHPKIVTRRCAPQRDHAPDRGTPIAVPTWGGTGGHTRCADSAPLP